MILQGNSLNTLPRILYNESQNSVIIEGRSLCLTAEKYFKEFISYFKSTIEKNIVDIYIKFNLDYINTKTEIQIIQFLEIVNKFAKCNNLRIKIDWVYEEIDEEIKETGQYFEDIINIPFNFIKK